MCYFLKYIVLVCVFFNKCQSSDVNSTLKDGGNLTTNGNKTNGNITLIDLGNSTTSNNKPIVNSTVESKEVLTPNVTKQFDSDTAKALEDPIINGTKQTDKMSIVKYLKKRIISIKKEIKHMLVLNNQTEETIKAGGVECMVKIFDLDLSKLVGNALLKEGIDTIKSLAANISIKDLEKERLVKILSNETKILEKAQLELLTMADNTRLLREWRSLNRSLNCFHLMNIKNVTGRSLGAEPAEDVIVLQLEYEQLVSELHQLQRRNEELLRELEYNNYLCLDQISNFQLTVFELVGNLNKTSKAIEEFQQKLIVEEQQIENLRKDIKNARDLQREYRAKFLDAFNTLRQFEKDEECFRKLWMDVLQIYLEKDHNKHPAITLHSY